MTKPNWTERVQGQGDDLALLREAAEIAGRIAMRHFRKDPEIWDKGHGLGPVTSADLEVDAALRAHLRAARPGYGWLSEETEDDASRLDAERVFILDPIDGTRAFIEGHDLFATALAVSEAGRPVAGVVHLPARGVTYWATEGGGAWRDGEPLRPGWRDSVEGARVLAARRQFEPDLWPGGLPPVERHFRSSLAYRLCAVAEGSFDAMVTLRDCWEWDIAAGALICAEAGAAVSDRHGQALRFNSPRARAPGVIAGAPAVQKDFLSRL